jgi:endoglucanase
MDVQTFLSEIHPGYTETALVHHDPRYMYDTRTTFPGNWAFPGGETKVDNYTLNWLESNSAFAEWYVFLKEQGFNSIRFQVTWYNHTDDVTYKIDEEWLDRVEEYVSMATDAGLYTSIDMTWDMCGGYRYNFHTVNFSSSELAAMPRQEGWLTLEGDPKVEERFAAVWKQIAERFKNYDEHLIFQVMNEPGISYDVIHRLGDSPVPNGFMLTPKAAENLNRLNQLFVDTVRATGGNNAKRFLYVTPFFQRASEATLSLFEMPKDPANNTVVALCRYLGDDDLNDRDGLNDFFPSIDKHLIASNIGVVITEFGSGWSHGYTQSQRLDFVRNETFQLRERNIPITWYASWVWRRDGGAGGAQLYNPFTKEPVSPVIIDILME